MGRRDPHYEYLKQVSIWFPELEAALPDEIAQRLADAEAGRAPDPGERGAVWTYITTDEPFGSWTDRVMRGLRRKFKRGGPQHS